MPLAVAVAIVMSRPARIDVPYFWKWKANK